MINTLAFSLSNVWSIIIFIFIICFVIAWHELGHLLVAKKFDVFCYEYSIGMGPLLYQNKKHETYFSVRAIPLGGYVKMAGEEGLEEGEVAKDNNGVDIPRDRILGNKSCGKRALVLAAGGIMNMILAIVCFYFYVSFNVIDPTTKQTGFITANDKPTVQIVEDTPLYEAGMRTDDVISLIETKYEEETTYVSYEIKKFNDISKALSAKTPSKDGQVQVLKITYTNSANEIKVAEVTRYAYHAVSEDGKEDVNLSISKIGVAQNYIIHEYNALTGIYGAWEFFGINTVEMVKALGRIFTGDFSSLSGLVGIYGVVDQVASDNTVSGGVTFLRIIYLLGAISFSLGFFNLIPFPALDGGRLVFVGIEAIRRKKINPNVEGTIHLVGIILLLVLMVVINIRDIIGLF